MRSNLTVLGKTIGTCDGWDEFGTLFHIYYDFQSDLPEIPSAEQVIIDYETGIIHIDDSNTSYTLLEYLK